MTKNAPELRFKGFTDDWELRKLGEVSDIIAGGDIDSSILKETGAFPVIANAITDDGIVGYYDSKFRVIAPAVTVVGRGVGVGRAQVRYKSFTPVIRLLSVKAKKHDAKFLESIINEYKIIMESTGVPQLTVPQLKQYRLYLTSLAEETQIGNFFTCFDNILALHQRKLDLLNQLKQAYLQKMFPKNGEKVPEIRFADFDEKWEQRNLGEIADRYDNLRVPITASERVSGETPYYGANGIQDYVEGYTHNGEFILIAEDGANDLKNYPVNFVNGKIWVNNHAHVLQSKVDEADNKFLVNAINNINIEPFLVGGGRAKLNANVMMKLEVIIPSKIEQQKIGIFFKQIDNTITLHQEKINALKSIKKTFLNKMII